ncbi:protein of unknown function [Pseudodesulfovibrio piezophilus C1TLV30]|uniref:Uncharacterized protein n=1 Tax=Pseudodesulfovibrio piezophilus (strain DSM 21447 / JCM 15486 / C1TLV30) TaxID=1322246 RepID=M1WL94_PSEP2|nr:protein of unknown function [Pseudodesulfovibrio piezophilus C1TLV30]
MTMPGNPYAVAPMILETSFDIGFYHPYEIFSLFRLSSQKKVVTYPCLPD